MRNLFLSIALIPLLGCKIPTKPEVALKEAGVAIGPVLMERNGHHYLRYRRIIEAGNFTHRLLLDSKRVGDEVHFYFHGMTSFPEWGQLIEIPLAVDGYEQAAKDRKVFWANPDGTKTLIPVATE